MCVYVYDGELCVVCGTSLRAHGFNLVDVGLHGVLLGHALVLLPGRVLVRLLGECREHPRLVLGVTVACTYTVSCACVTWPKKNTHSFPPHTLTHITLSPSLTRHTRHCVGWMTYRWWPACRVRTGTACRPATTRLRDPSGSPQQQR